MRDFVNCSFNKKQKILLDEALQFSGKTNITRFVRFAMKKHNFSKTTTWHNLKKMKKLGLLDFGDFSNKGAVLRLTEFGKFVKGGEKDGE